MLGTLINQMNDGPLGIQTLDPVMEPALMEWAAHRERWRLFLQGSFENRTYTSLSSDIDLVIEDQLRHRGKIASFGDLVAEPFLAVLFKNQQKRLVEKARDWFGRKRVVVDEKCIRIRGHSWFSDADVVPAFRLKEGIALRDKAKGWIASFPEDHTAGLVKKDSATRGHFTRAVRIFKQWNARLIAAGKLKRYDTPSFRIEALLFQLPNRLFAGHPHLMFRGLIEAINTTGFGEELESARCPDGRTPVLQTDQWELVAFERFRGAIMEDFARLEAARSISKAARS